MQTLSLRNVRLTLSSNKTKCDKKIFLIAFLFCSEKYYHSMKKYVISSLCILLALVFINPLSLKTTNSDSPTEGTASFLFPKTPDSVRIMSYNILSDGIGFDGFDAQSREEQLQGILKETQPDILGLQEASRGWHKSICNSPIPLRFTTPARYMLSGSMTTLLFNPETLTLLKSGTQTFRYSYDSRLRCFTWCIFSHKVTENKFIIINTHLSLQEKNEKFPLNQATELVEFIKSIREKNPYPLFLIGDLNSKEGDENTSSVYKYLSLHLENARYIALNKTYGEDKTIRAPINDYILCTDDVTVHSYNLLSLPRLNVISDHYPIFADVLLQPEQENDIIN